MKVFWACRYEYHEEPSRIETNKEGTHRDAAEIFVECDSDEGYDGEEIDVLVWADGETKKRFYKVTTKVKWKFEAKRIKELETENE